MAGRSTWSLAGHNDAPEGDFALDARGHLVLDHTAVTPMMTALMQHQDAWWASPDHGSRIAAVAAGVPATAHEFESAALEALAPLERDQRIRDITVLVTLEGNRAHIEITAHDISRAAPVTLRFEVP